MPSLDKNEPNTITRSGLVGGNYTRHEQCEFTCSAVSKFQKQNLVKVPFHFVSQQKPKSPAVVFDIALRA